MNEQDLMRVAAATLNEGLEEGREFAIIFYPKDIKEDDMKGNFLIGGAGNPAGQIAGLRNCAMGLERCLNGTYKEATTH